MPTKTCPNRSIDRILKTLMKRDGMTYEEASEFFSYNIERAFSNMSKEPIKP